VISSQPPAGFAEFVAERGDTLHDTACLMTGDVAAAEELLVGALAQAWPRWRRLGVDPEPAVRRGLAEGLAPRWQRGTSREPGVLLTVDDEPLSISAASSDPAEDPDVNPEQRAKARVMAVAGLVAARHRRRQRVAVGALVVLVAGASAAMVRVLAPQPHSTPRAAATVAPVVPAGSNAPVTLPAYYDGGRVLQSTELDLSRAGTSTLPFTPTVLGLDFAFRCPVAMSGHSEFEVRVNGTLILSSGCSGSNPDADFTNRGVVPVDGSSGDYGIGNVAAHTFWQALGLRIGRPARAVITVREAAFATSPPPRLLVGVYQDVPFAEYPLPQRPASVPKPYDIGLPISHVQPVTVPYLQVNGTWTLRLPYRSDLVVQGGVSGPGEIQVAVDGTLVSGFESYDYQQGKWFTLNVGPPWPAGRREPRPGQLVTISITMSHFVGHDWRLEFGRSAV
jgi:hypothetical protein